MTLPGTSLEASDQLGTALEQLLQRVPEVVSSARRTGRAERDEHVQGVESAEIDVKLRESDRPRDEVLEEIRGIAQGGGFGSIVGRNSFQRPKTQAIELLHEIMDIYANV